MLLTAHLAASTALGTAAQDNATAQHEAAAQLRNALAQGDPTAAHAAVDAMWKSFRGFYARLRESEKIWNDLATAAAGD
jgi:hypothetical protein